MRRRASLPIVIGLFVTCFGSTVMAQSAVTGAITGTLTDAARKAIGMAHVVARNVETKREVTARSDDEGRFRMVRLQPGNYIVEVTAPGFTSLPVANAVVEVGRTTTLEISLYSDPGQSALAPAGVPRINTTRQELSVNLNQTSFDDLPNNGRRWSTFALLAPATTPDGPSGAVSFRGISSLFNSNAIDGGSNDQTYLGSERGGTRIAYGIGLASIREVHINVSDYPAEYGGAAGGAISAVTKSGTNTFHGSAFIHDRDSTWGARNPRGFRTVLINGGRHEVPLKPVDTRYQFGGAAGGPVLENRLFFFGSYDQQRRNFPAISTTSDAAFFDTVDRATTGAGLKAPPALSDAQIDSTLAFLASLTGEVPRRGDQTIYTPRIDWHMSNRHMLTATYNRVRWTSPAGTETAPTINRGRASFGDDFVDIDWITVNLVSRISQGLVNELRGQFSRDHEFQFSQPPAPGEPLTGPHGKPPSIDVRGGIIFGKRPDFDARAIPDENRSQYADTITLTLRNHTIKSGFDVSHVNTLRDGLYYEEGTYNYAGINDFIIDYANFVAAGGLRAEGRRCATSARTAGQCYIGGYNQAFGRAASEFTTNDYGFFVQDDYRVSSRLTLKLGLRYEYQQLPEPQLANPLSNRPGALFGPEQTRSFPSDKNDVEPRLGFAYSLRGTGTTMIRGGYGIHHGRIPNGTIALAINSTGTAESQSVYQFIPARTSAAPVFPNTLEGLPSAAEPPHIIVLDPDMQRPSVRDANLVFEHALGSNTGVSVAYLFTAGRDLPTFVDVNLPAPASRTYAVIGGDFHGQAVTVSPFFSAGDRPDPRFGVITAIRSLVESKYHAVAVQLTRRLTKGFQFESSYTLSKATDNGQSSSIFPGNNYPSNPFDLSADQGPSDFDARHKFTATAAWSSATRRSNHGLAQAILNGFNTSIVFFAKSGAPYSAVVGGSADGGLRAGITGGGAPSLSQFPLISRNAFRLPGIVNVDLRVARRLRITNAANLEILGEAFNLLNRTQVTELNNRMYVIGGTSAASTLTFDPAFQTIRAAGNNVVRERQLQCGIRIKF